MSSDIHAVRPFCDNGTSDNPLSCTQCDRSQKLTTENNCVRFDGAVLNGGHLPLSGENGILRANERLATDDEARLLMAEMSPELEQLYIVAREVGVRCWQLGSLCVKDVDVATSSATIDGVQLKLSRRALRLIRAAIGDRTMGLVFASPRGGPWTADKVRANLNRIKRVVDVETDGKRVLI